MLCCSSDLQKFQESWGQDHHIYGNCPKISNTDFSDITLLTHANSADPDWKEQSDQGLPFAISPRILWNKQINNKI